MELYSHYLIKDEIKLLQSLKESSFSKLVKLELKTISQVVDYIFNVFNRRFWGITAIDQKDISCIISYHQAFSIGLQ